MKESKFLDTLNGIKENVQKSAFSKADYVKLFASYLNDIGYIATDIEYSKSANTLTEVLFKPAEEFRNFLKKQLIIFGMDASDIDAKMQTYQVRESDVADIHRFISEFNYQYLKTGRRLELGRKPDFHAAISVKEHDESLVEKKIRDKDDQIIIDSTRMVKQGAYLNLSQTSGCPDYLKTVTDKDGKPLEEMITLTIVDYAQEEVSE